MTTGGAWYAEVQELVMSFPESVFTLSQAYEGGNVLSAVHPANNNVESKIRQTLQRLRDAGVIAFLEPGVYRRLTSPGVPAVTDALPTSYATLASIEGNTPLDQGRRADAVPLEHRDGLAYRVSAVESRDAVQREFLLVQDYELELRLQGHETARHRIQADGRPLWTDLVDLTDGVLYEAKAASSRVSVRMAIGQLLDYRRFVDCEELRVLLPSEPEPDLQDLLKTLGIGLTFRDATKNYIHIPGARRPDREI